MKLWRKPLHIIITGSNIANGVYIKEFIIQQISLPMVSTASRLLHPRVWQPQGLRFTILHPNTTSTCSKNFPLPCHNERDGVSNHWRLDRLLNRLFRRRSKKHQSPASLACMRGTSTGHTSGFPSQRASKAPVILSRPKSRLFPTLMVERGLVGP